MISHAIEESESGDRLFNVVLSVGSNYGDRKSQVTAGIKWLAKILEDSQSSSIYTTGDCHGGKRDYMNAVVTGKTPLSHARLDSICKMYEVENGRSSEARACGDVPVDIDIVIYGNEILRQKDFRQQFFQIGYKELYT